MSAEGYRIVILLSRKRIALYYRQAGGTLQEFPDGPWPQPLALFPTDNGVILGEEAQQAFNRGNGNAIVDFFEEIKRPRRVRVGAGEVEIRQLLLHGLEDRFRELFDRVFFGQYGPFEANRANAPVLLLTARDVESNECDFLRRMFEEAGYGTVKTKILDRIIATCLLPQAQSLLLVKSDGVNLHFTLRRSDRKTESISLRGYGTDPRVAKVAENIWKDIQPQITDGKRESEERELQRIAREFLRSGRSELTEDIEVSTGETVNFFVSRPPVYEASTPETQYMLSRLKEFLVSNGVDEDHMPELLLWGDCANNDYFRTMLGKGFTRIHEQNEELRNKLYHFLSEMPIVTAQAALPVAHAAPVVSENPIEVRPRTDRGVRNVKEAPQPAKPATEWTKEDLRKLKTIVIKAKASQKAGNVTKVAGYVKEISSLADNKNIPANYASDIKLLHQFCNKGKTDKPKQPATRKPEDKPKPREESKRNVDAKRNMEPKSAVKPKPKPMPWTNDELLLIRRKVISAEASVKIGRMERVEATLAELRAMRKGRPWPANRQVPDKPTWCERIENLEKQLLNGKNNFK